ncbi:MAG: sigma-54-dependent transcriptional regulator [Endozoicomonas sp.]
MNAEVLIAGDDEAFLLEMKALLRGSSLRFSVIEPLDSVSGRLPLVSSGVLLLSAHSRTVDSCQFIEDLRKHRPEWAVVVVSARADRDHAIRAISAGAADYLVQPLAVDVLLNKVRQLLEPLGKDRLVAHAPATRHSAQLARRASVTDASILITGESGTGKEVFSRYIHQCSPRQDGPFVAVNCAAIPEAMLESTLFGHEKGAFTGAVARRRGKFEQASGGTLFLDEMAEMPLEQQTKLLRVLQEKEVERLGGSESIAVDVRIVSATNRDLRQRVEQGLFREDLYYRLNVFPLHLAPLRERQEDILPLTHRIMKKLSCKSGQPIIELSPDAVTSLQNYHWPGNIRELENVIQRACVLKRGWVIMADDLMLPVSVATDDRHPEFAPAALAECLVAIESKVESSVVAVHDCKLPGPARKQQEWHYLVEVLKRNGGHRSRSAEELGMTTRMLRYKLAQLRESGFDVDSLLAGQAMAS